ncbi:hypothetical protein [Natrinema altunense]|uniref:hypothetical protein n=1 Tax=Natrinema altunense TaxID=222984 RepID=UPI00126834CE|nr:hypothetical protein [Natrinema altunense]
MTTRRYGRDRQNVRGTRERGAGTRRGTTRRLPATTRHGGGTRRGRATRVPAREWAVARAGLR